MMSLAEIIRSRASPEQRLMAVCLWLRCTNETYLDSLYVFDGRYQAVIHEDISRSASPCPSGLIQTAPDCLKRRCTDPLLHLSLKEIRDKDAVIHQMHLFNASLSEVQRALCVCHYFTEKHELTSAMVQKRYGLSRRQAEREFSHAQAILITAWQLDGPTARPPVHSRKG